MAPSCDPLNFKGGPLPITIVVQLRKLTIALFHNLWRSPNFNPGRLLCIMWCTNQKEYLQSMWFYSNRNKMSLSTLQYAHTMSTGGADSGLKLVWELLEWIIQPRLCQVCTNKNRVESRSRVRARSFSQFVLWHQNTADWQPDSAG